MDREALGRPEPPTSTVEVALPAPGHLDGDLDRRLTLACSLVGRPEGRWAQVTLVVDASERAVPEFWDACNARVAQLCNEYGVEGLLVEEAGQVRIRIERYHGPNQADEPREPDRATEGHAHWPWTRLWRGWVRAEDSGKPFRQQERWSADAPGGWIDGR
jgi:hypothetical protein